MITKPYAPQFFIQFLKSDKSLTVLLLTKNHDIPVFTEEYQKPKFEKDSCHYDYAHKWFLIYKGNLHVL